jgi:hypothetical protein
MPMGQFRLNQNCASGSIMSGRQYKGGLAMRRTGFAIHAIVMLFLAICTTAAATAQEPLGSAGALRGGVYVLKCFVSVPGNEFSYKEKTDMMQKCDEAVTWLVEQAQTYNVSVKFGGGTFGLYADIKLDGISYGPGDGDNSTAMVSKTLKEIGYPNSLALHYWVRDNTDCHNAIVLIFVKGRGKSYAIPYASEGLDRELYFVEGAMLYEKQRDGVELAPAQIAHEILHLFGAWDLYETPHQTKLNETVARETFPNSVMGRVAHDINSLNIDPLTAWLIGWNNKPEPWFKLLKPKGW